MPKGKRVLIICLVLATGLIMNVVAFGQRPQRGEERKRPMRAPVRQNRESQQGRAPVRSNPDTSPEINATNTHPVVKIHKTRPKKRHRRHRRRGQR